MNEAENDFGQAASDLAELETRLRNVIIGQDELLRDLLTAIFAGGHVLLEGLPGLGKTHLAKAISALLGLKSGRVQCTPDLLPSDLTGSEVLSHESGSRADFEFRQGPLFANLVLVDEINRATPRTQAALLEAMQEQQVSYNGVQHRLPDPFRVIATQNPIELEGTFPLPEAQLDRFMLKLHVAYPAADRLGDILDATLDQEPADDLHAICSIDRMREIQSVARQVLVSKDVRESAIALILATQPDAEDQTGHQHIRYGASPRALQSLVRAARVRALMDRRAHVSPDDLAHLALPVLRHRILLRSESELDGNTPDSVLGDVISDWAETNV